MTTSREFSASAEVERVMELARKLYPVPQGIAQMDAEAALRAEVERLVQERDAIRDEQRQDAGAMLSLATIQAKCHRLAQERDRIKTYWFHDADPAETEFADEYTAYLQEKL